MYVFAAAVPLLLIHADILLQLLLACYAAC
jgi:hypothetical protein